MASQHGVCSMTEREVEGFDPPNKTQWSGFLVMETHQKNVNWC